MCPKKQVLCVFAAFSYFAQVLEQNDKPDRKLMKLFRRLTIHSKCSDKELTRRIKAINEVVKQYPAGADIEYILVSVCIISKYYEMTSRYRTYYHPMAWETILDLQQECIDNLGGESNEIVDTSMEFADHIVEGLLK